MKLTGHNAHAYPKAAIEAINGPVRDLQKVATITPRLSAVGHHSLNRLHLGTVPSLSMRTTLATRIAGGQQQRAGDSFTGEGDLLAGLARECERPDTAPEHYDTGCTVEPPDDYEDAA